MRSIENCDLDSPACRLDSPLSLRALRCLGLQLADLQPLSKPNLSTALFTPQHAQSYEQRRLQWIADVKKLRLQFQSRSPAKTSSASPMSTRLKPYHLREKHSLGILRAKKLEQLRQLAEADYFYEQQSRANVERSCMHQREKNCRALDCHERSAQVLSFVQAKKTALQTQLAAFKVPSKQVTQDGLTAQVQVAKARLAVPKSVSPLHQGQANVVQLLELRKARLERESQRQIQLEASFSQKDEAVQERVAYIKQLRLDRIQTFSEKERKRQNHIEQVRQERDARLQQRRREVEAMMQTVDSKAERAKSIKREESKKKGILHQIKCKDTLKNLERLQRAQDFSRQLVLSRIQEQDFLCTSRQLSKARQARSRQLLHKQLLSERHAFSRDFERMLTMKGPQFRTGVSTLLNKSVDANLGKKYSNRLF